MDTMRGSNRGNPARSPSHLNIQSHDDEHRIQPLRNLFLTFSDDDRIVVEIIEDVIDGVIVMTGDFVVARHQSELLGNVNGPEIG